MGSDMFYGHRYPYTDFHELNLDWILEQITNFESKLATWEQEAADLEDALPDIANLQTDVSSLQTLVNSIQSDISDLSEIRAKLNSLDAVDIELTNEIDTLKSKIAAINTEFDDIYTYFNNKISNAIAGLTIDYKIEINQLYHDFNYRFIELQREIDALNAAISQIDTSLINPWHSELGKVSPDINNKLVYADLSDECLTAEQYCSLGLSASNFASFDLTALNYAKFGKTKLHFRWVYSPVYGFKQEISNVLTSIVNFIKETISANDYALLDLSADDYASLDLTANDYYSFNTNKYVREGGSGLTSDEYSSLQLI